MWRRRRAIRKVAGVHPRIKWPNDLLLNGRKAAGILAESAIVGDSVWYAVLGIGINVSLDVSQSGEISSVATSVNAAAGNEVKRESLLRQLLMELDDLYIQLGRGQSPIDEWRGLLETTGAAGEGHIRQRRLGPGWPRAWTTPATCCCGWMTGSSSPSPPATSR